MFPESFVRKHLVLSPHNGVVFDPFCGRGTTPFEALLNGREAIGCDVNPVAYCVSAAKCDPPLFDDLQNRIVELSEKEECHDYPNENGEFFRRCFHAQTLEHILRIRRDLDWKNSRTDRFIAALALGALHGESHKSSLYFSNRMPRTISTKPKYSIRWWDRHGLYPPKRDVFTILHQLAEYRYRTSPPDTQGDVKNIDARLSAKVFAEYERKVNLIITSPPYLDTTNFTEDQWLRLWFLGGYDTPNSRNLGDDRYYSAEPYWNFIKEVWTGISAIIADEAYIVIRLGGKKLSCEDAADGMTRSLEFGLEHDVKLESAISSDIKNNQKRSFQSQRRSNSVEYDLRYKVTRTG
jgi:hypothetical protein